jgi:hypothetical protein
MNDLERFPTSNERTPIPFPQPINHPHSRSSGTLHPNAAIVEAYDIARKEIESGEVIVQSIEGDVDVDGDVDQEREQGGMGGKGGIGEWIGGDGEKYVWRGRVEWPESRERSSISREAKQRGRDRGEREVGRGKRARGV